MRWVKLSTLCVLFACASYQRVFGQTTNYEIFANFSITNCNGYVTPVAVNSIRIELEDVIGVDIATAQGFASDGAALVGQLTNTSTFNGFINISAAYSFTCTSDPDDVGSEIFIEISESIVVAFDGKCFNQSYTVPEGIALLSIDYNFFQSLSAPTISFPNPCPSDPVTLRVPVTAPSFDWRVSNDGLTWKTFLSNASSVVVASPEQLKQNDEASIYGNRFVQAIERGCLNNRMSPVSEVFQFHVAPPVVSLTPGDPKCKDGTDGFVVVSITINDPVVNDFEVQLFNSSTLPFNGSIPADRDVSFIDKSHDTIGNLSTNSKNQEEYYIVVTNNTNIDDYGACFSEREYFTLFNPKEIKVDFKDLQDVKCFGGNDGSVTVEATGGAGGFKDFNWGGSRTTATATGLASGTYTVQLKDQNDCPAQGSVTINQPTKLTVAIESLKRDDFNSFDVSCYNKLDGELKVSATGGTGIYAYDWTNGPSSPDYKNLGVGTYTVKVTDVNACSATESITLIAPSPITFSIEEKQAIACAGTATGSAAIKLSSITNAIGTVSYLWSNSQSTSEINNVLAGTYTAVIIDAQGCTGSNAITFTDPPAHSVDIVPQPIHQGSFISCVGESDGQLGTSVLDANGNPVSAQAYQWFRNGQIMDETSSLLSGVNAGGYRVVITYGNGCKAEDSYSLTDPPALVVDAQAALQYNGLLLSCNGAADGSLRAQVLGGTPGTSGYTYEWTNGSNDSIIENLPAGAYTINVRDANGCLATDSYAITNPAPVLPTILVETNYNGFPIRCDGSADAELKVSATGGTGIYTYAWEAFNNGELLSDVPAGTYTAIATDQNGCRAEVSITIDDPDPVVASIDVLSDYNGQALTCTNAANGRLEARATGGTNTFTYRWSTGGISAVQSGLSAGIYSVEVKDGNGCMVTTSKEIINPDPVIASVIATSDYNGFSVTCFNAQDAYLQVKGEGGTRTFTYEWINQTETSDSLHHVKAGNYTVIVRDENGCSDDLNYTLTEPALLTLSIIDVQNITCYDGDDGALSLKAQGGVGAYQYAINDAVSSSSFSFMNLKASEYQLSVVDQNACVARLTKELTQPDIIEISFTEIQPAFCADPRGSVKTDIRGGTGMYTYTWFDQGSNIISSADTLANLAAGIYTLQIEDGNACQMTSNIGIVSTDGPIVSVKEMIPTTCSYTTDGIAEVEVVQGQGPFTFKWQNGQQAAKAIDLLPGLSFLTVTDVNNCVTSASVEVTAPQALQINAKSIEQVSCNGGNDGSIEVDGQGGVGDYIYDWSFSTSALATGLAKGTYVVVLKDRNNCRTQSSFSISEPEPIRIELKSRTLPLCFGDCTGLIEVLATGGNGTFTYQWSNESQGSVISSICAGDYSVMATDSKACTASASFSLGQPTALQIRSIENKPPDCYDGCNGALAVEAFGGVGSYQYKWSTNAKTPAISNICADTYSVLVADGNQCETELIQILINPAPLEIDLGGSVTLCVGQSYTLGVEQNWASYLWSSNIGFSSTASQITIRDPGLYSLEVVNNLGCTAKDTFLLETSLDLLKASFIMPDEALLMDTVVFIDISWPLPSSIRWKFPDAMEKLLDMNDVIYGRFKNEGSYTIGMEARLGECFDELSKSILIKGTAQALQPDQLGYEAWMKHFDLYPNPMQSQATMSLVLDSPANVTLSIWSMLNGKMIYRVDLSNQAEYELAFQQLSLEAGTYILRMDHPKGIRYIRFIVQ